MRAQLSSQAAVAAPAVGRRSLRMRAAAFRPASTTASATDRGAAAALRTVAAPVLLSGLAAVQALALSAGPALAEEPKLQQQQLAEATAPASVAVEVQAAPQLDLPAAPELAAADAEAEQPETVNGAVLVAEVPPDATSAASALEEQSTNPEEDMTIEEIIEKEQELEREIELEEEEVEREIQAIAKEEPQEVVDALEDKLESIEAEAAVLEAEEKATPGAPGLIAEAQGILDELHALRSLLRELSEGLATRMCQANPGVCVERVQGL